MEGFPQCPEDDADEVAFEAAERFLVGLALGSLLRQVGAGGGGLNPGLSQDDDVQHRVQFVVARARKPVAPVAAGGDLDRGAAGMTGRAPRLKSFVVRPTEICPKQFWYWQRSPLLRVRLLLGEAICEGWNSCVFLLNIR
jgi:hypothetical protein